MKKAILILLAFVTILNVFVLFWWFYVSFQYDDFENVRREFFRVFPDFFKRGRNLGYVTLLTSLATFLVLFFVSNNKYRLFTKTLIIINIFLLTCNLWSMM